MKVKQYFNADSKQYRDFLCTPQRAPWKPCKFLITGDEPMTKAERKANKRFGAACPGCGGWHSSGGMSHYSAGPDGCNCAHSKLSA